MKKQSLLAILCLFQALSIVTAQNVFDPNDPLVNYNPSNPPATPPANTLAKWVRTPRGEVTFNTERFKAYYYNGMAFRLRFPNGYNPGDPSKKYPVILFFHGIGEIGPVTDNEINLVWGAQFFENKINEGQFDAFMLFPITSISDWTLSFSNINNVLDLLQQYCHADPDRLITMGLSLGGDGTLKYTFANPQRSAISIASSAASIHEFSMDPAPFIHIPFWIATGGQDEFNPPAAVQPFVDRFTGSGGDMRWTLYPDKAHGVWLEHWNEPYLVPYWQSAHKANPLVFYKQTQFPQNANINVRMGITGGYAEYQWQKDFIDMQGAGSNEIVVNQTGTYRVRFRRNSGGEWSSWSPNPVVISRTGSGDNSAPTSPGNLRVVSSSTNSINLAWDNSNDNVGVTGYDVFLNGVKKYSTGASSIIADNLDANTSYTFTVQAHDQAGNFSAFSNATQGTTAGASSGPLSYKFYQGSFNSLPNFSTLTPAKTGTTSNINIGVRTAGVNDNFAFLWEGYITIPTAGNYTFETISDDGSKLYINSTYSAGANALVNNDGLHGESSASGTINLAAGTYPMAATFFEQGGGETMQVYWSGPGIGRQLIPASAFTTSVPPPPAGSGGLNYRYYEGDFTSLPNFNSLTPVKTGSSSNVDISLRNPGVNDHFAFIWEGSINISTPGTYTFETVSDDGSKLYFNSAYSNGASALVNNDGLHPASAVSGSINIQASGSYPIAVTFFEATGGETMEVYWSGPGISRQLIPASAFSGGINPPTSGGLNYKYYEGSFTSLPNFGSLTPVKTGSSANVDIAVRTAGVNDNFAFLWEGYIKIPVSGNYTFETVSDDGSKLYFNSFYNTQANALVNNDGLHPAFSATGSVNISAGTYPIAISFFEASGGENMQVYWSGPGIPRQLIPNAAFTGQGDVGVTSGLNYKYYEGGFSSLPDFNALSPVKTGSSSNVDLGLRNPGVNDNFAFLWEGYINITTPGNYTFETVSDDGSKLYFNSGYSAGAQALVNNDGQHPSLSASVTVNIPAAGSYPIAISFFESSGGENMEVYWSGPGITRQLIPNSAFTTSHAAIGTAVSAQNIIPSLQAAQMDGGSGFEISQAYPNPFRDVFMISFDNRSSLNKISVDLFDVSGRLVHTQNFGSVAEGKAVLKIDASKKTLTGVYFVRMNINGVMSKMIKVVKK